MIPLKNYKDRNHNNVDEEWRLVSYGVKRTRVGHNVSLQTTQELSNNVVARRDSHWNVIVPRIKSQAAIKVTR